MIRKGSLVEFDAEAVKGKPVFEMLARKRRRWKVREVVITARGQKRAVLGEALTLPVEMFRGIPQKKGKATI